MAWRKPKNLREWVSVLRRHRKKFFFPAIMAMIAVVFAGQFLPRKYSAQAKFLRRLDVSMIDNNMGSDISVKQLETQRRLLHEDMMGRRAIEQLINDLGLTKGMPRVNGELTADGQLAKYDLVQNLTSRINVRFQVNQNNDELIVVSYSDTDREMAPKITNRLVENYIRKSSQELNEVLKSAQAFFDKEVTRYAGRVRELESKKLRFEMDHRGLLPDDPQSVQTKLVQLRSQLNAVSNQLRLNIAAREADRIWVKAQPDIVEIPKFGPNPLLDSLRDKLDRLEREYEAHKNFGRKDTHPLVKRVKSQLDGVKEEIAKTPKTVELGREVQPNTQKIEVERRVGVISKQIEELERQRDELQGQVEHYEILNRNFFVVRHDYMKILNDLEESEEQLKFWQENKRRTKIAVTTEVSKRGVRLRVIQHAPDLARPSWPTPIYIAMGALVIGFGIGALFIVLAELLDRSFRSVEQAVDDLKLPVLGAVNEIITPGRAFRRKIMGWGVYPATGLVLVLILVAVFGWVYLSLQQPHHYEQLMSRPADFLQKALFGN